MGEDRGAEGWGGERLWGGGDNRMRRPREFQGKVARGKSGRKGVKWTLWVRSCLLGSILARPRMCKKESRVKYTERTSHRGLGKDTLEISEQWMVRPTLTLESLNRAGARWGWLRGAVLRVCWEKHQVQEVERLSTSSSFQRYSRGKINPAGWEVCGDRRAKEQRC